MNDITTRERIVDAADMLFYQRGFEHTSFADIADVVKISRGNFYFHFKTKDRILDAVIDQRITNTRVMLEGWERESPAPADRIRSFINIVITNRAQIKRFGCPVGTLTSELAKLDHVSRSDVKKLFLLFREWLREQFIKLGCNEKADAYAMHLLARSQGVATLTNAFHDERFIRNEIEQMNVWLDSCIEHARGRGSSERRATPQG
jgi:TetR/AcrR family transcriptional regulator, transcriptional repressor for nem operon